MIFDLYVFRHGQTDYNKQKRWQGHLDTDLDETGISQAQSLRPLIQKIQPTIMLSSDLKRAKDTAYIARHDLKIEIAKTPALREIHVGIMEGKTTPEIESLIPDFQKWRNPQYPHFRLPGGESIDEHRQRVLHFIIDFLQSTSHRKIAIATHGGTLMRMMEFCENAPQDTARHNCCLHHFQVTEKKWIYIAQFQ